VLCELLVCETTVTFGDISGPRSRRVAQLFAACEVFPKLRTAQKDLNPKVDLVRELPCHDFPEVLVSSHGDESCNRIAAAIFKKSFGNGEAGVPWIAETATYRARSRCNFCDTPQRRDGVVISETA
jgi:hypothetical protein